MTVLGRRSELEAEHDLGPVFVLIGALLPGVPRVLADDAGALPAFHLREHAEACADALRAERLPGMDDRLMEAVAVAPCWRGFVTDALLHTMGCERGELSEEQAASLSMRTYIFETGTFGPDDARRQAMELAGRIARGIVRRNMRPEAPEDP